MAIEGAMRRKLAISCWMLAWGITGAFSADADKLYFTAKANGGPKVTSVLTGSVLPAVPAVAGKKPPDCPPNGFWFTASDALFRCKDDAKYLLVKPDRPETFPAGALILRSSIPTDDPGPSVK